MQSEDGGKSGGFLVAAGAAIYGAVTFGAGAPRPGPLAGLGGALQAQARAQIYSYLSQSLFQRQAMALHAFETQEAPGTPGELIVNPSIDPRSRELVGAIQKIQGVIDVARKAGKAKKLAKKQAKLEVKLEKRQLEVSPQADVRYAQLYGPNAGYYREYGAPEPLFLTQRSH